MNIRNGNDILEITDSHIKNMVIEDIRHIVYRLYPKFANKYSRPVEIMLKKSIGIEGIQEMIKTCYARLDQSRWIVENHGEILGYDEYLVQSAYIRLKNNLKSYLTEQK